MKKVIGINNKVATVDGQGMFINAVTQSGSIDITENGTYDVTDKASAIVNVGGGGGHNLPIEYQELKCIKSSGTQYIKLGIAGNSNYKYTLKMEFGALKSDIYTSIFGARASATSKNISIISSNTGESLIFDFNNSDYASYRLLQPSTDLIFVPLTIIIEKNRRAIYDKSGVLIAENTVECTDNFTTDNLYLFNCNGREGNKPACIFNELKVENGNTVVNHFIPSYRKSDYVVGLYDIITDALVGSATAYNFIAGEHI